VILEQSPLYLCAALGGLLLLVGSLVWGARRRAQLVARLVEQRTAELRAMQQTLHDDLRRREAMEEDLRKSDDRYRAFVAQSTEAIWRFEHEPGIPTDLPVDEQIDLMYRHGYLAECNDAMARLYGYESSKEMIGMKVEELAPKAHNLDYFRSFVEGGYRIADLESREVDRNGNVKYFVNNETGIVEDGLLVRAWGTQRDITERKLQAELRVEQDTRLQLAVAAANLGTWDCDLRTNHTVWSPDAEIMYGLQPGTFDGRLESYLNLVHPEDREFVRQTIVGALETGSDAGSEYDLRIVRPDGETRWLTVRGAVLRDDAGQPIRRLGTVMDITAEHLAEEEKARIERKLQETQKLESLGVLAGGIAHDFNNLLTGILGNASLARLDVPPTSPVQTSLEQIELVAQRAADLCKQMLAYSGKGRFIVQRLDLSVLVRDTADLLRLSISKNSVLKFSLEAGLPAINADATQMRQILMNLIINASEAIGENSGVITITTGVMNADRAYLTEAFLSPNIPEGDYVFLEVSDNGSGMDAETRARIFDPFFTTKFTGRGLGLAAVLGIVRGHQGALKVYSELGKGTTFKLLLPRTEGSAERLPTRHDASRAWRGAGTILVVDDEDSVRSVASRMLSALGFHVLTASNGCEALEVFFPHRDEIVGVLLDLTMPQLDGAATFTELRRMKPDIRVILMSGFNEQDAINRFAGKGLAGFVQKPFKAETLQAKLRAIFETESDTQLSLSLDPPPEQR
jgi:PAS domain S-box-containing protein